MNSNNQVQSSVNIDAITTAFEQSQEMYNRFIFLSQNDIPDDIMREAYEELIHSLTNAGRVTNQQYSVHVRNRARVAREARQQVRRERLQLQQPAPEPETVVAIIGETPILALTPPGPPPPLMLPVETMMVGQTYQSLTPPGPPPPHMIPGAPQRPNARRSSATSNIRIRAPKHTMRTLKRSELGSIVTDPCSICMDSYTRSNSVETSCAHTFCKDCYVKHEQATLNRTNIVCCPLCRHSNPIVTEFCARKTPVKRNVATTVNPIQV
jgi:hypothetical protein